MKNIKFRVWNNFQKRYNTLQYEALNGNVNPIDNVLVHSKECTIEQYTGLVDKNGVEIYEGDRVRYLYRDRQECQYERTIVKQGKYGVWLPMGFETICDDGYYNVEVSEVEVIGNIHESE